MTWYEEIDRTVFFVINGWHSDALDVFMRLVSAKLTWIPFYILLIYLIYAKLGIKKMMLALVTVAILILMSDTGSVILFKNTFQRYRPCHNLEIKHLVYTVEDYCGGQYGFVSSHAANFFALATFLFILLKDYYKRIMVPLFSAAFLVAISRVYLGVHYPLDVIVGGMYGVLCGCIAIVIYKTAIHKLEKS